MAIQRAHRSLLAATTGLMVFLVSLLLSQPVLGQFTATDTLRGALAPARTSWDAQHYDLHLRVDLARRRIEGYVDTRLAVLASTSALQLDLDARYTVHAVTLDGKPVPFQRQGPALLIRPKRPLRPGARHVVRVQYEGEPAAARNAPWDGGFVWRTDINGLPWVGVAVQSLGASSWWPCKDHPADEPDSVSTHFTLSDSRVRAVGNGQNRGVTTAADGSRTYHWAVTYPINTYNVTLNIGDYVTQIDTLRQDNGQVLPLTFYPLRQNATRARTYLPAQVKPMLRAYEQLLGPYPFPRDGYALVETHYWGMEHQGAVAYGNGYGSDPRGFDYGGWDFIIVHETGHEWFGNWISAADRGDLWIHESWTTYVEALYEESLRGYPSSLQYLSNRRKLIENRAPIQGPSGVNFDGWPDADMYYKGAWMLHSLRSTVANDSLWFAMLRSLGPRFGMRTVRTAEFTQFVDQQLGADYQWFWDAFLNHAQPPILRWKLTTQGQTFQLRCRWESPVVGFRMPIDVRVGQQTVRLMPTTAEQTFSLAIPDPTVTTIRFAQDRFYYLLKSAE